MINGLDRIAGGGERSGGRAILETLLKILNNGGESSRPYGIHGDSLFKTFFPVVSRPGPEEQFHRLGQRPRGRGMDSDRGATDDSNTFRRHVDQGLRGGEILQGVQPKS